MVHVLHSYATGGMEKGIATLVQNASAHFEHVILCLSQSGESERLLPTDTDVISLGKAEGNSFLFILKLARTLKALRPDIVHTRNWGGMDGIIAARLSGISSVVHGEHGWGIVDSDGTKYKRVIIRRLLSKFVKEFTCVSQHMELWLSNVIHIKKPIRQIYNGVDCYRFYPGNTPNQHQILSDIVFDPAASSIGIVSRLDPIKDHTTLFHAFSKVRSVRPEAQLVVVGDGPEREYLENIAGEGIFFLGNRQDIPDILKLLDVFVLPSINEGLSNTILEAMATAIPVVATHVGGNPELVKDDLTGLLVPPKNPDALAGALLKYLDDEGLRRRHGNAGRKRAEKEFSISLMVKEYEKIWTRLSRPINKQL